MAYGLRGRSGNSYCCCCLGRCQWSNGCSCQASSCLSGRWRMLEKQIFILVFARVYICVLFFRVLQNMPLYVCAWECVCVGGWCEGPIVRGCCPHLRLSPSPISHSVAVVVSLPCPEIFREILVIKRAHKYINSFERAAPLPPAQPAPSLHSPHLLHTSQFHSYEDGGQVVPGFYTRSAQLTASFASTKLET